MYQFLPNRIAYHSLQANAPICLSIAGALNLIAASGQDFALHSKPERHRFQFLQWPESFRASLYQVANSVTTAFHQAHLSMLDIEFCTKKRTVILSPISFVATKNENRLNNRDIYPHAHTHTLSNCFSQV